MHNTILAGFALQADPAPPVGKESHRRAQEAQAAHTLSSSAVVERLLEKLRQLLPSEDTPRVFVLEASEVPLACADGRAILQDLLTKV